MVDLLAGQPCRRGLCSTTFRLYSFSKLNKHGDGLCDGSNTVSKQHLQHAADCSLHWLAQPMDKDPQG